MRLSERHLNRIFDQYVGMNIKTFSRLIRKGDTTHAKSAPQEYRNNRSDFYTEKIGLTAVWGDRNGPYTSFAVSSDAPPCFAIFSADAMTMFQGYRQPNSGTQPDTVVGVIPTLDLAGDYRRLKAAAKRKSILIQGTFSLGIVNKALHMCPNPLFLRVVNQHA